MKNEDKVEYNKKEDEMENQEKGKEGKVMMMRCHIVSMELIVTEIEV